MKNLPRLALPAALLGLALFTGCATQPSVGGGTKTTLLAGAITVDTASYQPPSPTTVDVDTTKLGGRSAGTGGKVSLLWGLLTLHDY